MDLSIEYEFLYVKTQCESLTSSKYRWGIYVRTYILVGWLTPWNMNLCKLLSLYLKGGQKHWIDILIDRWTGGFRFLQRNSLVSSLSVLGWRLLLTYLMAAFGLRDLVSVSHSSREPPCFIHLVLKLNTKLSWVDKLPIFKSLVWSSRLNR